MYICSKARSAENPAERILPKFSLPKPDLIDGLSTMHAVWRTTFSSEQFAAALRRTFVKAGVAPLNEQGGFVKYTGLGHSALGLRLERLRLTHHKKMNAASHFLT